MTQAAYADFVVLTPVLASAATIIARLKLDLFLKINVSKIEPGAEREKSNKTRTLLMLLL